MSYINLDIRETHIVGQDTREQIINPQTCRALSLYHLLLAGISYATPPFRFVRTRPAMQQLLVCLSGRGEVWVNGDWVPCTSGMAYLTPAESFHAYHAVEQWELCWVMYDTETVPIPIDVPALMHVDPQELFRALEGLYHEYMGQAEEVVMHQWVQLVQTYAQRMIGQKQSDQRLRRLWKIVDANLSHPWSSEELAAHVGVSSEHLRRLCHLQLGMSPMRQLAALRMQRAMALLTSEAYTIEAVAWRVGYENPFAFSTAFRRYVGLSPSEYRDQARH